MRRFVPAAALLAATLAAAPRTPTPERKALEFLSREVPLWSREHRCYSCHNNGDAARALYEAVRLGRSGVSADALADSTRWLSRPAGWDKNGGDGPFSDKMLARVQFASALAAAVRSGAVQGRAPLETAAARVAGDQAADGSWPVEEGPGTVGSPAAYGRPLATLSARETLRAADPVRYREALARADRWLSKRPVETVLDASVALLAVPSNPGPDLAALRERALTVLRAGQSREGGWGPYVSAPPEPFDTALALLALAGLPPGDDLGDRIKRGRDYLIASQQADGAWPETTRPAGAESYAQRLSTTGWATLALLATGR